MRRRFSKPLPVPSGGPLQDPQRKRRDSNSQRTRVRDRFSGPAPHPAGSLPRAQCGARDSNPQRPKPPDLQSGPLPVTVYLRVIHPSPSRAGGGIRTREGVRRWFCRPAPSAARAPLHLYPLPPHQHARRDSNPQPPELESGAPPVELQARVSPFQTGGGKEMHPLVLQHVVNTQPAWIPARGSKAHGTGSRVRQAGARSPRRVSTRTASFDRTQNPSCQKAKGALPSESFGEAGRLASGAPGRVWAARALHRTTSHGASEIRITEQRTAPRFHRIHDSARPLAAPGARDDGRRRPIPGRRPARHGRPTHLVRGRLQALGGEGTGVHRRIRSVGSVQCRGRPGGRKQKGSRGPPASVMETRRAADVVCMACR